MQDDYEVWFSFHGHTSRVDLRIKEKRSEIFVDHFFLDDNAMIVESTIKEYEAQLQRIITPPFSQKFYELL